MQPNKDNLKAIAAKAALDYIEYDSILGVGSGSTVAAFIDLLPAVKGKIDAAVSSSHESTRQLKALGIPVLDLNQVDTIPIYVDGADEINAHLQMIKGGGAALTSEKIVASVAKKFICIADGSKKVDVLGVFPLPIEVIPQARSAVGRALVAMGGSPVYREHIITDHGNIILDVQGLDLTDPLAMESRLNDIPGVVCNGLFAKRSADVLLLAGEHGVDIIK
ncbi:MAG: ribose-5-phosphate isomerase RpiA [Pseudomonadota bacterium]